MKKVRTIVTVIVATVLLSSIALPASASDTSKFHAVLMETYLRAKLGTCMAWSDLLFANATAEELDTVQKMMLEPGIFTPIATYKKIMKKHGYKPPKGRIRFLQKANASGSEWVSLWKNYPLLRGVLADIIDAVDKVLIEAGYLVDTSK
jgi:hypothetical protein